MVLRQSLVFLALSLLALTTGISNGQGSKEEYRRAGELRERFAEKVFRANVTPSWSADARFAWYRLTVASGQFEFVLIDAQEGRRRKAFDHEQLARQLGQLFETSFSPSDLPLRSLQFNSEGQLTEFQCRDREVRLDSSGERWTLGDTIEDPPRRGAQSGNRFRGRRSSGLESPDKRWRVEIRDANVWLRAIEGDEATQLSFDGNQADAYVERVYWAPNSSRFVVLRRQEAQERQVRLIESSPEDQLQPRWHELDYLKPGDRVAIEQPQLFDVPTRTWLPVSDSLFRNRYRLRDYRWASDSSEFYFTFNERGHQVLRVIGVDGFTGAVRAVVDEQSDTFIDYAYKQFRRFVGGGDELIWMSERDGWNHLYLFDVSTGRIKNQITRGDWVVRGVDHVDDERRQIWFRASGVFPEQDPYYVHACRVNFDGSGFTPLTRADGTHAISYSPDRKFLIATHSRVDLAPVTELRRGDDGTLVAVLERADLTGLFKVGWRLPERFVAPGRDGETKIYGVIYRPTNFSPDRQYPVIEHIYAGPHGSHVPKDFRAYRSSQMTAELGFVVVRIDGMGTSNRSKAFHDVCWRNLKDAGFPDRIQWMQAAAQRYPYMDLTRVGIYGGSAGGQNTVSALLHYPDFYHVGVADCGCHDNRMDKIWWNELWMGWPVGPHYEENSNVTHASRLQGKLLLTVAELDRNVDPASTLQLVNALIKADKTFDFMMVPGAGHGVGDGSPYMVRMRQDFFVRHLLDSEPRWEAPGTEMPAAIREQWGFDAHYSKYLDRDGFPIVSSAKVSDYALLEAGYLADRMLDGRTDIRQALIDLRFRYSVMAVSEFTTDIPEHRDLLPADFWDRRARGLGATRARPAVSCGEENLLQHPGDPYQGESIMIHEFAHAIHEAIRTIEPGFDQRLETIYQQAMGDGLWSEKYAATNRYEYFAECVQSFFDDNRENDLSHNHVDTRAELEAYDPRVYRLIRETFRDNPWRYLPPKDRVELEHLEGYDFSSAPSFVWPDHLRDALQRSRPASGKRDVEIVERDIEGWTVAVDIQLLEGFDAELGERALALLRHQLYGISLLMPVDRLHSLRQVGIRLDRDSKTLKGIQYHPSKRWLVENGHDSRLAKMVHIPQAARFVSRSLSAVQPRVVLHELAHGYHDQFLGFGFEPVRLAYDAAKKEGRYEKVLHIRGQEQRHYALTDHKEYFAEATEAYFGANDFYPFVRSELKEHDPGFFALLQEIWGKL